MPLLPGFLAWSSWSDGENRSFPETMPLDFCMVTSPGGIAMDMETGWEERLDAFTDLIADRLHEAGWFGSLASLAGYLFGLLLPGERKSMEPIAERLDPEHTQAKHAAIQWFITDSEWDHQVVLKVSREYGFPLLLDKGPLEAWIVDEVGETKWFIAREREVPDLLAA